jgi:hypothetical protein
VNATPFEPAGAVKEKRVTFPTTVPVTSVQVLPLSRQNLTGTSDPLQNSHELLCPVAWDTVTVREVDGVPAAPPVLPVIVSVWLPTGTLPPTLTATFAVFPVIGFGVTVTVMPLGAPVTVGVTFPVKFDLATLRVA